MDDDDTSAAMQAMGFASFGKKPNHKRQKPNPSEMSSAGGQGDGQWAATGPNASSIGERRQETVEAVAHEVPTTGSSETASHFSSQAGSSNYSGGKPKPKQGFFKPSFIENPWAVLQRKIDSGQVKIGKP